MIDVEAIRRLNNCDTHSIIRVLEINEDRLYHWLVLGSITVVLDDVDRSIQYANTLRKMVRSKRPDYVGPYEAVLSL